MRKFHRAIVDPVGREVSAASAYGFFCSSGDEGLVLQKATEVFGRLDPLG